MSAETPRTCTLGGAVFGIKLIGATGEIKPGERVQFIEKVSVDAERERILDVLERLRPIETPEYCNCDQCEAWRDATALLREHGRLTDSPSSAASEA